MNEILAEYSSKSSPGKVYRIIQAKDGTIYCDCWTWKRTRTCGHLKDYYLQDKYNPHHVALNDQDGALIVAIDKAISELS